MTIDLDTLIGALDQLEHHSPCEPLTAGRLSTVLEAVKMRQQVTESDHNDALTKLIKELLDEERYGD